MHESDSDADTGARVEVEIDSYKLDHYKQYPLLDDECDCDLCTGVTDGEDLDGAPVG